MKTYECEIEGTSPYIWNVYKKELADELQKLKKNEMVEWDAANWKRKASTDEKGNVIIRPEGFKQAIVDACRKTRMVPHFATHKNETFTNYANSLMIQTVSKPVCKVDELEAFGCFVGARGKNSDTKVWKTRPMVRKWRVTYRIIDPAGRVFLNELKTLIEHVGILGGLGDNRINNYGRFDLVRLAEVK